MELSTRAVFRPGLSAPPVLLQGLRALPGLPALRARSPLAGRLPPGGTLSTVWRSGFLALPRRFSRWPAGGFEARATFGRSPGARWSATFAWPPFSSTLRRPIPSLPLPTFPWRPSGTLALGSAGTGLAVCSRGGTLALPTFAPWWAASRTARLSARLSWPPSRTGRTVCDGVNHWARRSCRQGICRACAPGETC